MTTATSAAAGGGGLERLLRRDLLVVLLGVALLAVLAWAHVLRLADRMHAPEHMAMPMALAWGAADFAALFAMWAVMMAAMMLPSAAPMILLFAATNRTRRRHQHPAAPTTLFVAGYLLAWSVYSALAASAQVALHNAALLSPMMVGTSRVLGGTLLIAAGLYQWTPLKRTCLSHCRSPLAFLSTEWREGALGALRMGLKHGSYCVGCCWVLMALLFVGGVMNVLWVAAIAVLVLAEKLAPRGLWLGRVAGGVLAAWGVWLLNPESG
ncbi:MAG: DUF2182 domain-containing protein [Gemmatimonadota bacterium]